VFHRADFGMCITKSMETTLNGRLGSMWPRDGPGFGGAPFSGGTIHALFHEPLHISIHTRPIELGPQLLERPGDALMSALVILVGVMQHVLLESIGTTSRGSSWKSLGRSRVDQASRYSIPRSSRANRSASFEIFLRRLGENCSKSPFRNAAISDRCSFISWWALMRRHRSA
jgi:hypothetical protein